MGKFQNYKNIVWTSPLSPIHRLTPRIHLQKTYFLIFTESLRNDHGMATTNLY